MDWFRVFILLIISAFALNLHFDLRGPFSNVIVNHPLIQDIQKIYEVTARELVQLCENQSIFNRLISYVNQFDLKYTLSKMLMARSEWNHKAKAEVQSKNNFASLYGGASIIEKNVEASNTNSILDENSDKFMINKCSAPNKFVVISLKEDININGFAILNTEFYSSSVKDIIVYGSNEYPVESEDWVHIGEYRLKNLPEWQQFPLKTMWTRYVRFEFKSHYGNEFYCTITQIKVFGSPILADFKKDFMSQTKKNILDPSTQLSLPEEQGTNENGKSKNTSNLISQLTSKHPGEDNTTSWDVFKALRTKLKEVEGDEDNEELKQSQSIFKILTNNISEMREFIERQVEHNYYFEQEIGTYKSQLKECQSDKHKTTKEKERIIEEIEDLRIMFITASILLIAFSSFLLLAVCYRMKR